MLTLTFSLTREEYFEYNYFTAWSAPSRRRYRLWYYGRVFLLYSAVAGIYIVGNHSHNLYVDVSIFSLIALIYFSLVPSLVKRSIRRRVQQILEQPENSHILGESEIVLSDQGISDKDSESESRYSWEAVVRKEETPLSYFLYTNSYHAIVIPKRTLKTRQEMEELNRLLNEHLPLSLDFSS